MLLTQGIRTCCWAKNIVLLEWADFFIFDQQGDNGDHHKRRHGHSQQPSPSPPRDQVKHEAMLKKRRKEKRDDLEAMVNKTMKDPKKLNNSIFDPIRTLVTDAVLHPMKYDLTIHAAAQPNH